MYKKLDEITKLVVQAEHWTDRSYIYGSKLDDDFLLNDQASFPKFGSLARKTLAHYFGDKFDLQTSKTIFEIALRQRIMQIIQFKILHRLNEYDWEYIDHFFRKFIGDIYEVDLGYDQKRIDKGFAPLNISCFDDDIKFNN